MDHHGKRGARDKRIVMNDGLLRGGAGWGYLKTERRYERGPLLA